MQPTISVSDKGSPAPQKRRWFVPSFISRMRLQTRISLVILAVSLPLLILLVTYLTSRAAVRLEAQQAENLRLINHSLTSTLSLWLRMNEQILKQLVAQPEIISMDPLRQKPVLKLYSQNFPHLFLVHTTDLKGMNVARSDDEAGKDYSDREWFRNAANGVPLTIQTLISRTTGKPSISMSAPIRDASDQVVGVGSIVFFLDSVSQQVQVGQVGRTGYVYVVDTLNTVVAHPDPAFTTELRDLSAYPPIRLLRQGQTGRVTFSDEEGRQWSAYIDRTAHNWGVVVQQEQAEFEEAIQTYRRFSWIVLGVGGVLMLALVWWLASRLTRPVVQLTETAKAIAAGDIHRMAPVGRQDELGMLAEAFNRMTAQLRDLIGSLEQRVADRTRALQTSAEVSRRLSTILNQEQLVKEVVEQLQSAFHYYHVHIYLFDESGEKLIMVGGTGEVGRILLERHHQLPRGKGLVGRAAERNAPVLVPDVSRDPGWLPNPLLPETKAEAAVPIASGGNVLGVLDVQQNVVAGLKPEDVDMLQLVANQVAVALQNARAYARAQRQAEHQARLGAIAQQIQATTRVEDALKVAARELGRAVGAPATVVRLRDPAHADNGNKNPE